MLSARKQPEGRPLSYTVANVGQRKLDGKRTEVEKAGLVADLCACMAACCCKPAGRAGVSWPDVEAGPAADRSARASLVSASGEASCPSALSEVPAIAGLPGFMAAGVLHAASEGPCLLLSPCCASACRHCTAAFRGEPLLFTMPGAFFGDGFLAGALNLCCSVSC